MTIISINTIETGQHLVQSQSDRSSCWLDGWIEVPPELEQKAWESMGDCDLDIEDGILVDIIPKEIPVDMDKLKEDKINELSAVCEQTIYKGQEIQLSDGSKELFEYKQLDQTNIKGMFDAVVFGATCYPYQSDSGTCKVYQAADIITLYTTLEGLRTAQLTYYHQLKELVNTLEIAEEINAVTYGQPLKGEYLQHYNDMMQVAKEQMQAVLAKVAQNAV